MRKAIVTDILSITTRFTSYIMLRKTNVIQHVAILYQQTHVINFYYH